MPPCSRISAFAAREEHAMATNTERPLVIALEEHYTYQGVMDAAAAQGIAARPGLVGERLKDLGEKRLEAMDEAGIDVQVISPAPSILQQLNAETSVELAMGANNALREAIDRYPDRFAGFAAVPTPDPQAAADELERAVTEWRRTTATTCRGFRRWPRRPGDTRSTPRTRRCA